MNNHECMGLIRPPIFNGNNLVYWIIITKEYLQSLGADVWEIVEGGYQFPVAIPTDLAGKKLYEAMPKKSILYLEVYQNQNFSKSCNSRQPNRYGKNHSVLRRRLPGKTC